MLSPKDYSLTTDGFHVYTGDKNDIVVQENIRNRGTWDVELTMWLKNNIKPGWICLDIGANIGYTTYLMAKYAGPSGKVYGFEPISRLTSAFEYGRGLNIRPEYASIDMITKAISNTSGSMILKEHTKNVGGSTLEDHEPYYKDDVQNFITIETTTLRELNLGHIDFIKLDIEGHEEKAWEGFSKEALECPLIITEISSWCSNEFFDMLFDKYIVESLGGFRIKREALNPLTLKTHGMNVVLKLKGTE